MRMTKDRLTAMLLGLVTFFVFANGILNDYNLDDELVTNNQRLTSQGISALPDIFTSYYFDNHTGSQYEYRPVVLASFAIEHTFFDESPTTSHIINLVLYVLTIMVLYFTLRSILPGDNYVLSLLTTLLFALHPLHTEVVDSIKNRDEMLCFVGGILALRYAYNFVGVNSGRWLQFALFIFFFAFAILSKRSILAYALVIPIVLVWFRQVSFVRLLLVSLVLAFGFFLLSPSPNQHLNLLVTMVFVILPAILNYLFHVADAKVLLSNTTRRIKGVFSYSFDAPATIEPKKDKPTVVSENAMLAWYGFYMVLAGALIFLGATDNGIWLHASALALVIVYTLLSPKPIKKYLLITTLLVSIAITAWYQSAQELRYLAVLCFAFMFYSTEQRKRIGLALTALVFVLLFALFPTTRFIIENSIIAGVLLLAYLLKGKKWALVIVALFVLKAVAELIKGPLQYYEWLVPLGSALFFFALTLPQIKKQLLPLLLLLVVPFFIVNVVVFPPPQANPANIIADNSTSVQVAGFVPAAGRQLDEVENPLVNANDLNHRTAMALKVTGVYLRMLVLPTTMSFYYGYNQVTLVSWGDALPWLMLVLVVAATLFALYKRAQHAVIKLGIVYLLACLLFISNLGVLVAGVVADRLAFIASLGFCLIVAAVLELLLKGQRINQLKDVFAKPVFAALVLLITVAYSVRDYVRNQDWQDRFTLFTHDIENVPNSAKAQQLVGLAFLNMAKDQKDQTRQKKELEAAYSHLSASIQIDSNFYSPVFNMTYLYAIKNDCDAALPWLERSLRMEPEVAEVLFQYAYCLSQKGRLDEAAQNYEHALRLNNTILTCYQNLAQIYKTQKKYDLAVATLLKANQHFNNNFDLLIATARTYADMHDYPNTVVYFKKAFALHPNDGMLAQAIAMYSTSIGDKATADQYNALAAKLGVKQ